MSHRDAFQREERSRKDACAEKEDVLFRLGYPDSKK